VTSGATVRAVPYRASPPRTGPQLCEVCSEPAEGLRCVPCNAVALRVSALEVPVVVVSSRWTLGQRYMGVGMALIDRWRKIAFCACKRPTPPAAETELVARAHATLWALTARIVGRQDFDDVLEKTLYETRLEDRYAVRHRFESAMRSAINFAEHAYSARQCDMGTELVAEVSARTRGPARF